MSPRSMPARCARGVAFVLGALLAFAPTAALHAQPVASASPRYPTARASSELRRSHEYAADLVGWVALGRVLWSSGYDQVVQSPAVWPRDGESYGRRFATRSAQLVAIESVRHGLAATLHRDPAYTKCACDGFWSRVGHVTLGTVTDFDTDGRRRVGWPRFGGALAGALLLGQLQPGQGKAGTVAFRAVTTVGAGWLGNAAKEFGFMPGAASPTTARSAPSPDAPPPPT